MNPKQLKFLSFLAFLISLSLFSIFLLALGLDETALHGLLIENRAVAPFLYLLLLLLSSLGSFPLTLVAIPGIFIFLPVELFLYLSLGSLAGGLIMFFTARTLGRSYVEEYANFHGEKLKALHRILNENSFAITLLLNLFYFFPKPLANSIAGVTRISFRLFLTALSSNLITSLALILLLYGIKIADIFLLLIGAFMIFISSLLPIIMYKKHLRDILAISFPAWMHRMFG